MRESIEVDLPRAANGGETVGADAHPGAQAEGRRSRQQAEGRRLRPVVHQRHPGRRGGLKAAIQEALDKDKEAKAIVSADQDCSHGEVIHLIDVAKGEGITKFAINIEKTEGGAPAARPASP